MGDTNSHGIRIRVSPTFGAIYTGKNYQLSTFTYKVIIENTGEHSYQLLSRFWIIKDPLYEVKIIRGQGVIGKTPILLPNSTFSYQSNTVSKSGVGAMKGHYTLKNLSSNELLLVPIPCFQLTAEYRMN